MHNVEHTLWLAIMTPAFGAVMEVASNKSRETVDDEKAWVMVVYQNDLEVWDAWVEDVLCTT